MSLLNEASFLVTPNGYKEDKLYAAIPTNGNGDMTVTRTGTATRVNAAGLVELVPYNLLLRSQEFDNNDIFVKGLSSIDDPNTTTTTAPDGTLTADTWKGNGAIDDVHKLTQTVSATSGVAYTQSVFAKKGTNDFIQILGIAEIYDSKSWANFDLENGAVGAKGDSATATITDFGNGWYRCTMTATATATASGAGFSLRLITSAGSVRAETNSLATSVHLWGAQVVKGSSALTYQKTVDGEDIPRIDYTGGGCPSILLEPQRTNLLTYSEQFDNVAWVPTQTTIDDTKVTAPDGSVTAQRLVPTVVSNSHYIGQSATFVSGIAYTLSVYAKADGYRYLRVGFPSAAFASSGRSASFDLQTGDAGAVQSGVTTSIVNAGNGWFRCSITATANASASGTAAFNSQPVDSAPSATFTGDGTSGAQLWGAQLEAAANPNPAAYPTSYIPTTNIALTRIADVINRDDIYTNNLITDAGGTWFVDLINNVSVLRDTSSVGLFIGNSSDGVAGDVLAIRNNGTNRLSINKRIAGSQQQLYPTTTETVKIAIKWGGGKAKVFVNGALIAISPGVYETDFNTTDMEFFRWTGADVSKYIKQMALFPTPLSDDQCIALTTL